VSKMMAARADLYRALETYTAILIQQYGNYSVSANGQFVFSDLDRFNLAANSVNFAATKVNELDAQRKEFEQSQKEAWKSFVSQ